MPRQGPGSLDLAAGNPVKTLRELRWPLVVFLLCLPVILLASGQWQPWRAESPTATPLSVPAGDQEMAWIHTTTNANTWERFVTGIVRTQTVVPGLKVDDSRAFLDSTTETPELVLSSDGHAGKLHIRWYKLQNEIGAANWVQALAARTPAPLAVIGGGSTDRALDLAYAMAAQTEWKGDRPPLLITTATADFSESHGLGSKLRLVDIYDDRTFRFCFSNHQMAKAVIDFVWQTPALRPTSASELARGAVASAAWAGFTEATEERPAVLSVKWDDDPYSIDLHEQFASVLSRLSWPHTLLPLPVSIQQLQSIPYSIGGLNTPNWCEATRAVEIAEILTRYPTQRLMLVLSSTTHPARRLLRTVLESQPSTADKLVVVTGDGIPVNAILRDGEFAWPVASLALPLVLFAHNDPTAWDAPNRNIPPPPGYTFAPPNSTEEAMHFGELGRVVVTACYPPNAPLVSRGDTLIERLHARRPAFFDTNGERLDGTGEHVVVVRPWPESLLTVWRRGDEGWKRLSETPLDPRTRPGTEKDR